MSGEATDAQIGGLLVGLAAKGTTVEELVGAATVMREKAIPIDCPGEGVIIDTCGTGGDVRGTFNISTAAALIVAAAGVRVVKHGNRSATSKAGSADVLEKLGVKLELTPEDHQRCLRAANICFAFARYHHPAMKFVGNAQLPGHPDDLQRAGAADQPRPRAAPAPGRLHAGTDGSAGHRAARTGQRPRLGRPRRRWLG